MKMIVSCNASHFCSVGISVTSHVVYDIFIDHHREDTQRSINVRDNVQPSLPHFQVIHVKIFTITRIVLDSESPQ